MALIVDFPDRSSRRSNNDDTLVQFSETVDIRFVERHTPSNAKHLWYKMEELLYMKAAYKLDALDIQRRLSLISSEGDRLANAMQELHVFGIENIMTPALARKRISTRESHWQRVMTEQARQICFKESDPDRLANVAEESARWSRERSMSIGMLQSKY